MVDVDRRKKLALHLRHLSVGLITNDEFESSIVDEVSYGWLPEQYYRSEKSISDDPVIKPMLELSWGLYSDLKNYKLKDQLPMEALKIISRCILFLNSEIDYKWNYFDIKSPVMSWSLKDFLIAFLTFGKNYRIERMLQEAQYNEMISSDDYKVWPFRNREEYKEALRHPLFLKHYF